MNEILKVENIADNEKYCLIFQLDNKIYGIDVDNILEIVSIPKLEAPQQMPKNVVGMMTYNKSSIKVIDLCSMLNGVTKTYELDAQVIIVKTGNNIYGIITDKAINVRLIQPKYIQSLPYHSNDNLIQYLYKIKDKFISIIDLIAVNNVLHKRQAELQETPLTELLPSDEISKNKLVLRQQELIKKFEKNMPTVYYDQEQYIIFSLGKNYYAITINYIKEIVKFKNVSLVKIPSKYNFLEGIFNLRGDFISVYNFSKFLRLPSEETKTENEMLIVLELKDFKIALLVDEIQDIITINKENDIQDRINKKLEARYILNEFNLNDHIVSVINIDALTNDDRLYIKD